MRCPLIVVPAKERFVPAGSSVLAVTAASHSQVQKQTAFGMSVF
jgi:hypothetical protein